MKETKWFLVPSMINDSSGMDSFEASSTEVRSLSYWRTKLTDKQLQCVFRPVLKFLPTGVFERLICLAVAHSATVTGSKLPRLQKNHAMIWIGPEDCMQLSVRSGGSDQYDSAEILLRVSSPDFASKALGILTSMIDKVTFDISVNAMKWDVALTDGVSDKFISRAKAKKKRLKPWFAKSTNQDKQSDSSSANIDISTFLTSLNTE